MRVAVIGAGIVGVTTAYELAVDGHEVTVFERQASVAAETSFANAGVVAPGYVTPWAAPGMPAKVWRQMFGEHAAVRMVRPFSPALMRWVWRWWRACRPSVYQANRSRMIRLARYSLERMHLLTGNWNLDYEQARGLTVLLRTPRDLRLAHGGVKLLAELGVNCHVIDAARARQLEPGLNPDAPLHAALHLPDEEVGNCRQFAHLLKQFAQRHGALFRFHREVERIEAGEQPLVRHRALSRFDTEQLSGAEHPTTRPEPEGDETFDAIVVCAAIESRRLLAPLKVKLPLAAVHGYSITAPMREATEHGDVGPRSALMDETYKVAISRLGRRVRVAGGAELGGDLAVHSDAAVATLYKVLDDWFPGAAVPGQVQTWKGARPMLPDGPPVIGPSGKPGVWLNLGHGSSGWALACGSARLLADRLGGKAPAIDLEGLGIERLRG
ncbi:MAG: D-amino acid dehydrogenase [Ideonella sp.]|nr:D-amino acid dehydrogenase [Ideonella sp.]MCC7459477.1 D-amino acid dehydrogenase [Nitrospira sp.]